MGIFGGDVDVLHFYYLSSLFSVYIITLNRTNVNTFYVNCVLIKSRVAISDKRDYLKPFQPGNAELPRLCMPVQFVQV